MSLTVSYSSYALLTSQGSAASRAPMTASECDARTAEKKNLPALADAGKSFESPGTRVIAETHEDLGDGAFRRSRTFEQEDGRNFTRIEEFTFTDRGARRTVIQQNPSGNITRYEEVLDREGGGTFRRTQRFQDEAGETSVQITPDYKVTDPFILTGGQSSASFDVYSHFTSSRGTQLDLSA